MFVGKPYSGSFESHTAAKILSSLGIWAALLAVAACLQWQSHTLPSQTTTSGRLFMPDAHTLSYCVHQAMALPPLLWNCCNQLPTKQYNFRSAHHTHCLATLTRLCLLSSARWLLEQHCSVGCKLSPSHQCPVVSGTKDKRGAEGWQAQIRQACLGCCGLHQCWQILPLAGLDPY